MASTIRTFYKKKYNPTFKVSDMENIDPKLSKSIISCDSDNALSDADVYESSILLLNDDKNDFDWIKTPTRNRRVRKEPLPADRLDRNKSKNASNFKAFCEQPIHNIQKILEKEPSNAAPVQVGSWKLPRQEAKKDNNKSVQPATALLKGSRRRNVEAWLAASKHEGSARLEGSWQTSSQSDGSLDATVRDVLNAIYGPNWKIPDEPRSKTEVKKPTLKAAKRAATDSKPLQSTRKFATSVRRKIFDERSPKKDIRNNFDGNQTCDVDSFSTKEVAKTPRPAKKIKLLPECGAQETPRRTFLASLSVSTPTSTVHPDAQNYKINFAKTKDNLVSLLYKMYNVEIFHNQLPADFAITWNPKMRGTAGFCYNKKKKVNGEIVRVSRIEMAPKVVDRADRLRDTLIHEMCHAAAWIIDGVINGHGPPWKAWTKRAMTRFPELPPITKCHSYKIETKYTYRCTACFYSINRQTRSIDIERKRCGHCFGTLELLFNRKKKGKAEVPEFDTTRTLKAPNAFGIFVKENYLRLKKNNADIKHGEIMKMLSKEYAAFKLQKV